jgi:lipopolysaccharide biosynthesis regulator YciM
MGAALVLLLVGLGAMAAGVLIGRYYVPDDRQLRRAARHGRAYMRALSHLIARDHETAVAELRTVVEENVDDVEPYFALGALFRSRGEHERAIRVHQALALRERDKRKLRQRAMYELGLDFRAAGMPRRATRAMEEVLLEDPSHEGALRLLAALYEEQARFNEAAGMWQRLGRRRGEDHSDREHHLLVAAAQAALARDDLDSAKQLLKAAQKHDESAHFYAAAAELAAARGNHRGAKDRLKQALIADPGLAPHLLPGLIAAEQGLTGPGEPARHRTDDLDDPASADVAQLAAPSMPQLTAGSESQADAPRTVPSAGEAASTSDAASSRGFDAIAVPAGTGSRVTLTSEAAAAADAGAAVTPATALSSPATARGAVAAAADAGAAVAPATALSSPTTARDRVPSDRRGARGTAGAPIVVVPLAPADLPSAAVIEQVLAVLAEVEAQTGPRLELALLRAQLVPPADAAARAALASELTARFPGAMAARVATARLALATDDRAVLRGALEGLVAESGVLAWALRGRWQCAHCGHRPGAFSWRCGQCRRWSTLHMETGVEPPPVQPRERRAAPRGARPEALLGASPDESLPAPTIDPGLTASELANAGVRRSLLGRVGGWVSGVWRRDAS